MLGRSVSRTRLGRWVAKPWKKYELAEITRCRVKCRGGMSTLELKLEGPGCPAIHFHPWLRVKWQRRRRVKADKPLETGLCAAFFQKGHLRSQINKTTPGSERRPPASCQFLQWDGGGVSGAKHSIHCELPEGGHFTLHPQGRWRLHLHRTTVVFLPLAERYRTLNSVWSHWSKRRCVRTKDGKQHRMDSTHYIKIKVHFGM